MAAGDFSPSALVAVKLKAENMWRDAKAGQQYVPETVAAQAILRNQTARIRVLEEREKDRDVTITWLKACDMAAEDCEPNCEISEPELESDSKPYALDTCKKTGFSVDREKSRTNMYEPEEVAALGTASALKVLDEFWARQALVKLKLFQGVNVHAAPFTWNAAQMRVDVPAASYNRGFAAEFLLDMIKNRQRNSYVISNEELYIDWTNARFDAGNADGAGDARRVAAFGNIDFDLFNFGAAGIAEDLYVVENSAVAMTTKTFNPDNPTETVTQVGPVTRYTIASPTLPGVRYDVYYSLRCEIISGKAHYRDTWRFETNGGIFLNPEACPVTVGGTAFEPTGVLAYAKV